jgi:hypothetical protein
MLYFPLIPRSRHQAANFRTNASGISRGNVFQGCRYCSGKTSANCGMPKCARLTRHVESSRIRLTGTRSLGFETVTFSGRGGRSPRVCARASPDTKPKPATPAVAFKKQRRVICM